MKKVLTTIMVICICITGIICLISNNSSNAFLRLFLGASDYSNQEIDEYARKHGISISEYSNTLIALYERNPDTKTFVLEYPEKKDIECTINLREYEGTKTVPLLMQWDQRWGYSEYAGDIMGLSGCGPTCLSMVCIFLTGDTKWNPKAVADFAQRNDYVAEGSGTKWTLFSNGAKQLGLDVTELPLDKQRIIKNLKVGNPIICSMRPGDFTSSGHFIVMVGYKDGKIKINDPNSYRNSKRLWSYEEIAGQIKNLWAFR